MEDTTDFIDVPENDTLKAAMAEVIDENAYLKEEDIVGDNDTLEEKAVAQVYICGAITQPECHFNEEPYDEAILQVIGGTAQFLDEVFYRGELSSNENKEPMNRWGVIHLLDRDDDDDEESKEGMKQWSYMALWTSKSEGSTDLMVELDEHGDPISSEKWFTLEEEDEDKENGKPNMLLHCTIYPQIKEEQIAQISLAMTINDALPDGSAIIHHFD